ncbi:hypothetical protein [Microbacterium sp. VKM Ac-2923]|uniref:hypothetical protein n=1 Tax=Microbacterium sp. VKM Ac-2923 TaxID=2929476 RepID=UPI001FB40642|nr:hypothetical protein [Microbacterium sp. VKM Ac-2923]MCJ1709533.1 hypothetical protein [Microbacterium sp. VKM Ac-2923]
MSDPTEPSKATLQFMTDMADIGHPATIDGDRILYDVDAIGGPRVGQFITTGVSVSEVQGWPLTPPHWIHLPENITFPGTNVDVTDCPPGWRRHSRDFSFTDMSVPPALAWLRHVRGQMSMIIPMAA